MAVGRESANVARERFERLFDDHHRAVTAYALRRASRADAEEVVAETFLVAWRRLDDVPSDAKPWLLGVARRVLATQRRAAGRREALRARAAGERESGSEPGRRPPVIQALGRLSRGDRELLLLVAWDGLSTREVAAVLGCSAAAAKVRLHRARCRLRVQLEALEPGRPSRGVTTRRLEELP
jgi:RNA polymerase sigma-70 factor (ECF subfamily)